MSKTVIGTVVFKVASPCNINCTYCYEYNRGDESWRLKPKRVSIETARVLALRIREYCVENGLSSFAINLHGGEPMLLGAHGIDELVQVMRTEASPINLRFGLQSNATLVTDPMLDSLRRHGIRVGASLDGGADANRFRVDHNGNPTWEKACEGIRKLRDANCLAGIQAVIDLDTEPESVLQALGALEPHLIELGQPFGNYDNPPATNLQRYSLGAWLCEAFDVWISDPRLSKIRVQVFVDAIESIATERSRSDWFSSAPPGYLIVAADGAYEGLDTLKIVGTEGRVLGLDIYGGGIGQALDHPFVRARDTLGSLCSTCMSCSIRSWCAGGYYPTRYWLGNGYQNPSIYCSDLKLFFMHVGYWMADQPEMDDDARSRIRKRIQGLAEGSWTEIDGSGISGMLGRVATVPMTISGSPLGFSIKSGCEDA